MKKIYLLALLLITAAVLVMAVGFSMNQSAPSLKQKHVAFYVTDDTGVFFMQLKRGVEDAALDMGAKCTLEVVAPNETPPENGYEGAVVFSQDAFEMKIPQVFIGKAIPGLRCVTAGEASGPIAAGEDLDKYIALLENGDIEGFFAMDPYAMGYRALEALVTGDAGTVVPLTYITLDNLYAKETIKLVFPLLQ